MCLAFPTCEPVKIVMQRVAGELSSAADELAAVETCVADIVGGRTPSQAHERLQTLDRLVQQLRALDVFLRSAEQCDCGRVDIETGLDRVWLETMRRRLGGASTAALEPTPAEPDLW